MAVQRSVVKPVAGLSYHGIIKTSKCYQELNKEALGEKEGRGPETSQEKGILEE